MASELLDWVNAYLQEDEDIVVPIKKMWNEWRAARAAPSLAEFTTVVLADERCEEMPGVDHDEGWDWMTPQELAQHVREQEEMGFYSGPRVKLKARQITLEHITKMIKKHNDRMEAALHAARATLPDGATEEDEDQLVEIMKLARQFRRQLQEIGLEADDAEASDDEQTPL